MFLKTGYFNKWRNKLLIHVVCGSWFSWRYELLVCFDIGGPRIFPTVAATMISKRLVKLGIMCTFEYYRKYEVKTTRILFKFIIYPSCERALKNRRVKSKIGNRLWISFLVRAAVLYQTLLCQTQTKRYWSKFS